MNKALGRWCLPSELSCGEVVGLMKDSGFDAIEWALEEHGEISLDTTDVELETLAAGFRDAGIRTVSVATGLLWRYGLTDNRADVRDKAKAIVRRSIDVASAFGADCVLVVPGVVNAEVGYDTAWIRALDGVRELAGYAEEKGITIGIENVWNRFLLSPREMREFIDTVGSRNVGAYLDIGNIMQYGVPTDWIRTLGKRLACVHVKGFNTNPGGWKGFVGLLDGDIDWAGCMAALREVGYGGYLVPEVSVDAPTPMEVVRTLSAQLGTILAE